MRALPLFKRGGRLFVGISDPTNTHALDEIKFHTNLTVEPILVDEDQIRRTIDQWLESADALADAVADSEGLEDLEVSGGDDDLNGDTGIDAKGDDTPVVKFINKVLVDAIRRGASDIHFEPYETDYRVRLRIDGLLKQVAKVPVKLQPRIAARLKVMAQLDIAEKRVPQDGRIKLNLSQDQADRLPRQHAAHAVRREDRAAYPRRRRRQAGHRQARLRGQTRRSCSWRRVQKPYGMVLVTGPTGSGKTVSLYTALNILNDDDAQHLHRRGPGRNPRARHQPGADERQARHDLRRRAAQLPAPGPGRDHGRRDPRPGNRRDRASRPRRPATWCCPPCTPTTRRRPSRA